MYRIPHRAFEYLCERFPTGSFYDIKSRKNNGGLISFKIKVQADDTRHRLEFNADGSLISHHTEYIFEDHFKEGGFYGIEEL